MPNPAGTSSVASPPPRPFDLVWTLAAGIVAVACVAIRADRVSLVAVAMVALIVVMVTAVGVGTAARRIVAADAWMLLASGQAVTLAVEADRWSTREMAMGTWPLVAILLGYLLTAWGLVVLARHLTRVWDPTRWIDSLVVTLGLGLAVACGLVVPQLDGRAGWEQRWAWPAIPAIALLLVLFATRSLLAVGPRPFALRAITAALVVSLAGDVLLWWARPAGLASPPGIRTASTAAAAILLTVGALHPSVAERPHQNIPWRRLGAVRFTFLVASLLFPLATLAILAAEGIATPGLVAVLSIGAASIGVLVLIRVSGLVTYADALADDRHRSRFEALADHSYDAITILDGDGSIVWASPAVTRDFGIPAGELIGRPFSAIIGPGTAGNLSSSLADLAARGLGATIEIHATITDGARPGRAIEGTATNLLEDAAVAGTVIVIRDVTERVEMQRQLVDQAFVDSLTGLANRALLLDRTSHALARTRSDLDRRIALLFVDLDEFKEVNDSLGHGHGDEVLIGVGRRIAASIGPAYTAARLGGDEFAVLLEGVDAAEALVVARRLLRSCSAAMSAGPYPITISASIGVAMADASTTDASVLLRNADLALYEAKKCGKNQVQPFRVELHERELRHFTLRSELPGAMATGQLRLAYQPIVDMETGTVIGAEALLRWDHPTRGPISPTEFIPLAEATRDIVPLGLWVLRTACEQLAAWTLRYPDLSMDINVSAAQLLEAEFADDVAAVLAETGVDPGQVVLELTESILVHDGARATEVLSNLRALGVRLAIDDFGTGYSSLAYLQNFPIDIVKIDRSFVSQLGQGGRGRSLARSIVAIADSLGIDTIAEGIETEAQAADLAALDCHQGQGFHYGRPVDPGTFERLADESRPTATAMNL